MSTIWKYPIRLQSDPVAHSMPKGARVLNVGKKDGMIVLWVLVDPDTDDWEKRAFVVLGTGGTGPEGTDVYVGTVQLGDYVWHVFERIQLELNLDGDKTNGETKTEHGGRDAQSGNR